MANKYIDLGKPFEPAEVKSYRIYMNVAGNSNAEQVAEFLVRDLDGTLPDHNEYGFGVLLNSIRVEQDEDD
jgi:hypothetical protein